MVVCSTAARAHRSDEHEGALVAVDVGHRQRVQPGLGGPPRLARSGEGRAHPRRPLTMLDAISTIVKRSSRPARVLGGGGMRRCALIALGGNALCGADQEGTYAEQRENARAMAASIGELIDAGWRIVVVHGNGPQVGALAVQQEEAAATVPAQPLSSLCAMTQGYLGSLIALALRERLGRGHQVVSVVTHVVVHGDDPGFAAPSKPIGPFLSGVRCPPAGRGSRLDRRRRRRPRVPAVGAVARAARHPRSGRDSPAGRRRRRRHRVRGWRGPDRDEPPTGTWASMP